MGNWTRDETIVAMNVYCKIPFKSSSSRNPIVIKYADMIGRTPSALNLKIGNLGRFDPVLRAKGIVGLANGSKMDEIVWNEFFDNPEKLACESEKIIAKYEGQTIEKYCGIDLHNLPEGKDKERIIKERVYQSFFHDVVLCSYENKCCITGISNKELLEVCHISSWKDDCKNRTNPKNGLCMNALFHSAFDKYLFAVTPDYIINISQKMLDGTMLDDFHDYLAKINGKSILLPEKFAPDKDLLAIHYENYLKAM